MSSRFLWGLIEIESEYCFTCFSRILTEISANNGFQWFSNALLNFTHKQSCTYRAVLGKFAVVYAVPAFSIFPSATFSPLRNLITRLHLKFLLKFRKNYKNIAFRGPASGANCTLMADSIRVAQPISWSICVSILVEFY